jgi:hypothetical protein
MVAVNSAILLTKWKTNEKSELKGNKFKVQTGNSALRFFFTQLLQPWSSFFNVNTNRT